VIRGSDLLVFSGCSYLVSFTKALRQVRYLVRLRCSGVITKGT